MFVISLVAFILGALAFSVLVLTYLRHRRRRGTLLAVFTGACAAAFLINAAIQIASTRLVESPLISVLAVALALTTGVLPPLVLHLVYAKESRDLPFGHAWIAVLIAVYAASAVAAILNSLAESAPEYLNNAPAFSLGFSAALGLAAQTFSRRPDSAGGNHRRWSRIVLSFMLAAAILSIALPNAWVVLLPDYLLLVFFCVTLYYEERLLFFDLLMKRGAFFMTAFSVVPRS